MNDFNVTLWLHTSMTQDELTSSIEELMPSASYVVEDQCPQEDKPERVLRTINMGPGLENVEVRDKML